MHGAVTPAAMVEEEALPGGKALRKTPGGGLSRMTLLGLMDSTHLAGPAPDPQGVVRPTNRENKGRRSDAPTNGTAGGGEDRLPYQQRGNQVHDRRGWGDTYR